MFKRFSARMKHVFGLTCKGSDDGNCKMAKNLQAETCSQVIGRERIQEVKLACSKIVSEGIYVRIHLLFFK